MKVLALDLSKTRTGWSCWQPGWEKPRFGSWQLGSEHTDDGMTFAKVHQRLSEHQQVFGIESIYFEEPIVASNLNGNTNANTVYLAAGIASHVESFAYAYGLQCKGINVSSWRVPFIGRQPRKTKSPTLKSLTIERCRQLGMTPRCDNEADAIGLLTYSLEKHEHLQAPWLADEILRPALGGPQ